MTRYLLAFLLLPAAPLAHDSGLAVWSKIYEVFSHPRCANCHAGSDNVPIWSGTSYGPTSRPHGMNINAGKSRIGAEHIPCDTCHTAHNVEVPHGPPGAEGPPDAHPKGWALAKPEMQWTGKSSADICAQIKDRAHNGGRSISGIGMHRENDGRLLWAWAPGPGRESAPYSAAQLVDLLRQWDDAGAPCPTK